MCLLGFLHSLPYKIISISLINQPAALVLQVLPSLNYRVLLRDGPFYSPTWETLLSGERATPCSRLRVRCEFGKMTQPVGLLSPRPKAQLLLVRVWAPGSVPDQSHPCVCLAVQRREVQARAVFYPLLGLGGAVNMCYRTLYIGTGKPGGRGIDPLQP